MPAAFPLILRPTLDRPVLVRRRFDRGSAEKSFNLNHPIGGQE
jgi:hypothetical protein